MVLTHKLSIILFQGYHGGPLYFKVETPGSVGQSASQCSLDSLGCENSSFPRCFTRSGIQWGIITL